MKSHNNSTPNRVDQTGGPLTNVSPEQVNRPENEIDANSAVYAEFGMDDTTDVYSHPDDEAADTILYTDNITAQHAMEQVPNGPAFDELPEDMIDEEITEANEDNVDPYLDGQ
ncbi:hypothetical protein GCM10023187_24110 [Nibrella viscosa]|uniref:Uncharacterized protein n=1 Tax=Nibrella viscosa TaxID=1084524 RepID=A0ABP8KFG9_9BACT